MSQMRRESAAASAVPKVGPVVMIEDPFDPSNQQALQQQQQQQQQLSDSLESDMDTDYYGSGAATAADFEDPNKSHPIRLASKTILSHLVNHLFHFPMCAGNWDFFIFGMLL